MSSIKKRQLSNPETSSNKIRQPSPTSVIESLTPTSPRARAIDIQKKLPGLSIIPPDTLQKTTAQLEHEHQQEEKEHRRIQAQKTNEETLKNIKEGLYISNDSHFASALSTTPQEPDIHKQYAEADKKKFKELDENKDWGLTFGGKKSKRKTRKTKRKTRKTKRKTRKSKKTKRKTKCIGKRDGKKGCRTCCKTRKTIKKYNKCINICMKDY